MPDTLPPTKHVHGDYCYFEYESCPDCWGDGEIVTCVDDICNGLGECMHGDGMSPCRNCKGRGEIRFCVYEEANA